MTAGGVPEGAKPAGSKPTLRALSVLITALRRDVDALKRAVVRAGARTLDGLLDVEALYDHWTDAPKHGQALRWDTTRESKYHGLATFADPTVVPAFFELEVTGAGTWTINEFLVDSDWDVSRPCLVTATLALQCSWSAQEVSPATDPITFYPPPSLSGYLLDGDGGAGTGEAIDVSAGGVPNMSGLVDPIRFLPLSWIFTRGRPRVTAQLLVTSEAWAGMSAAGGFLGIRVYTRVTRL